MSNFSIVEGYSGFVEEWQLSFWHSAIGMHDTLCLHICDCLFHHIMNLVNPTVALYLPVFQRLLNRLLLRGVSHLPPRVFIGSQMLWIQEIQHPRFLFRRAPSDRIDVNHPDVQYTFLIVNAGMWSLIECYTTVG